MMAIAIDLGCGSNIKNPFNADEIFGIDVVENIQNVLKCDLGFEKIPFQDCSVDYVTAFDLLEHIPRVGNFEIRNPFIFLMSEIWRVLKPNGLFYAQTPAYPNVAAFSDPTHVNFITVDTVRYFAKEKLGDGSMLIDDRLEICKRYGFVGDFVALQNYSKPQFGHQIWLLQATGKNQ